MVSENESVAPETEMVDTEIIIDTPEKVPSTEVQQTQVQCSERQFDFVTFDVEAKRHRQFKSSTSNVKKKTST